MSEVVDSIRLIQQQSSANYPCSNIPKNVFPAFLNHHLLSVLNSAPVKSANQKQAFEPLFIRGLRTSNYGYFSMFDSTWTKITHIFVELHVLIYFSASAHAAIYFDL